MKKNKFLLLLVISLLALGGGFIDGYTYLIRDGSFATMQTGNLIFLTLHLLSNDISSIKRFLFPIISFVIGTIFIVIIRNYMKKKIDLFRLVSFGFVIIFIVASSFISIGEYNFISTSLLSFASSIQLISFSNLDRIQLTTTMCSANLKNVSENIGLLICEHKKENIYNALKYLLVILSFVLGVILSYLFIDIFAQHSILLILIAYLVSGIILLYQQLKIAKK